MQFDFGEYGSVNLWITSLVKNKSVNSLLIYLPKLSFRIRLICYQIVFQPS
jgi:hypothetical protein